MGIDNLPAEDKEAILKVTKAAINLKDIKWELIFVNNKEILYPTEARRICQTFVNEYAKKYSQYARCSFIDFLKEVIKNLN